MRLELARIKLRRAELRCKHVELEHRGTPEPDGSLARRNARLEEMTARKEYTRVLKIFTNS
jgi:hypothetical protein